MSAQTQLAAVPPKENALQVFQVANGLDPYLKKIRDEIDAFVPDVSTRKGREAIASIAYSVARSKTALDNVGKELVAELKDIPKKIDAERKRMRDTLDAWQEEVRRPLTEWQAAEDARIDKHNDRMEWLRGLPLNLAGATSSSVQGLLDQVEAVAIDDQWDEFKAEAAGVKDLAIKALRAILAETQRYEAEQAELARLRAEAEAREKTDREAAIARAAAEQAQREADERAAAERAEAARREQALIDQAAEQKRASEQAARAAEAAAERQRLELQLQAEQAERQAAQAEANRIAAEQRAEQERLAAAKRAEQAAEQARIDERRRADAAAAEIIRQQEARAADTAHKAKINRAALEAFIAGGMPEACAKQAVTLIAQRKIPNIAISY